MSTQFPTPEAARDYGVILAGVDPTKAQLREDPDLRVTPAWLALHDVDDPEYEQKRAEALADQKGYRFLNGNGMEVGIVVDAFRDGWCVWGVAPNGAAFRF